MVAKLSLVSNQISCLLQCTRALAAMQQRQLIDIDHATATCILGYYARIQQQVCYPSFTRTHAVYLYATPRSLLW